MKRFKFLIGPAYLAVGLLLGLVLSLEAQTKPQLTSTEPISSAATITPNNGTTFSTRCRAVYIGGAGNITVDVADGGTNLAFNGVVAGSILPVRVKRVYSTGTTATGLLCLY